MSDFFATLDRLSARQDRAKNEQAEIFMQIGAAGDGLRDLLFVDHGLVEPR